uniref:Putative secreted protein n=1 Tax=Anopheles marajoara TaxID=58244 RepID=A0A2M4CBE5_9DIPT
MWHRLVVCMIVWETGFSECSSPQVAGTLVCAPTLPPGNDKKELRCESFYWNGLLPSTDNRHATHAASFPAGILRRTLEAVE